MVCSIVVVAVVVLLLPLQKSMVQFKSLLSPRSWCNSFQKYLGWVWPLVLVYQRYQLLNFLLAQFLVLIALLHRQWVPHCRCIVCTYCSNLGHVLGPPKEYGNRNFKLMIKVSQNLSQLSGGGFLSHGSLWLLHLFCI